ncbi:MAG: hypothetical protein STSR0004_11020 [Peptococcaceae bacterium]
MFWLFIIISLITGVYALYKNYWILLIISVIPFIPFVWYFSQTPPFKETPLMLGFILIYLTSVFALYIGQKKTAWILWGIVATSPAWVFIIFTLIRLLDAINSAK